MTGIFISALVVVGLFLGFSKVRAQESARQQYFASLARLMKDPANAHLRQQTLQLGRDYAELAGDKKGVSLFDEAALSNDINAACAQVAEA